MADPNVGKVYAVDDVHVAIARYAGSAAQPSWLIIHAIGRAPTTGWTPGELSLYVYLQPPNDRVQEFDFNERLPGAGAETVQVLTPISAHLEMPNIDIANYWGKGHGLAGIRIHAVCVQGQLAAHGP